MCNKLWRSLRRGSQAWNVGDIKKKTERSYWLVCFVALVCQMWFEKKIRPKANAETWSFLSSTCHPRMWFNRGSVCKISEEGWKKAQKLQDWLILMIKSLRESYTVGAPLGLRQLRFHPRAFSRSLRMMRKASSLTDWHFSLIVSLAGANEGAGARPCRPASGFTWTREQRKRPPFPTSTNRNIGGQDRGDISCCWECFSFEKAAWKQTLWTTKSLPTIDHKFTLVVYSPTCVSSPSTV